MAGRRKRSLECCEAQVDRWVASDEDEQLATAWRSSRISTRTVAQSREKPRHEAMDGGVSMFASPCFGAGEGADRLSLSRQAGSMDYGQLELAILVRKRLADIIDVVLGLERLWMARSATRQGRRSPGLGRKRQVDHRLPPQCGSMARGYYGTGP